MLWLAGRLEVPNPNAGADLWMNLEELSEYAFAAGTLEALGLAISPLLS